jgi:hypothetical protein
MQTNIGKCLRAYTLKADVHVIIDFIIPEINGNVVVIVGTKICKSMA